MRPTPERLAEIRAWAEGSYPDGKPHIPEGCPSFTRDLLAEIDALEVEVERAFGTGYDVGRVEGGGG